ncbi:fatty acid desaturase-domain-containing protein [Phakopsora pachyrhizi]|nr:fatty acid desaturase-domain-containing protein [Phakopsora pachyrhizi]
MSSTPNGIQASSKTDTLLRLRTNNHISNTSSSSTASNSISTFTPPDFTIKELLDSIPAHCFKRSALKSSSYVVWDFFLSSCLIYLASHIDHYFGSSGTLLNQTPGLAAQFAAWALYGYSAGLVWTGLWVIAHECGHQSFSTSKKINNTVGWFLHSALLVPYHSWRISHAQHHAATGHMTRDQVFVPKTRSQRGIAPLPENATKREREGTFESSVYEQMDDLLEDAPFWNLLNLLIQQLLGWPAYIIANASGQVRYPAWTNHFDPKSIIFDKRHRNDVIMSDLGIGLMLSLLMFIGYKTSFMTILKYYIVPYLWVNHWLVMITYLQHTDPQLPHYRDREFSFQRGALCTIDRNIHGFFFHGIAETHVAHHICSKIPHYNAWEATEALKAKLGEHYHQTDENCWKSLYKSYSNCKFVEDEGDVVFYKNSKGRTARKVVMKCKKENVSDSGIDVNDLKSQ